MDNYKVRLKYPLTHNGKEIKEINIREPFAGELRGLRMFEVLQGDPAALGPLLQRISTPVINPHECNKLSFCDVMNIVNTLSKMLEIGGDAVVKVESPTT